MTAEAVRCILSDIRNTEKYNDSEDAEISIYIPSRMIVVAVSNISTLSDGYMKIHNPDEWTDMYIPYSRIEFIEIV